MRTATLERYTARLEAITAEIAAIRSQGEVIQGCRLDIVAPGGTAGAPSQKQPKYARLRWGRGADQGSRYVPLEDIPHTKAAVERGKAITALEREADRLQKKMGKE